MRGKSRRKKNRHWFRVSALRKKCLLQLKDVIHWRSAIGESFPSVSDLEIILFSSFVERGLAVPASDFD